jgi:hypothetical protein
LSTPPAKINELESFQENPTGDFRTSQHTFTVSFVPHQLPHNPVHIIAVVGLSTLWELDVWSERSLYFMSLCNHYQSWLMQKESGVGICLIGEK